MSLIALAIGLNAGTVRAEGSRSLYPANYNAAGFRADLDVSSPGTLYANVAKRSGFLYVFAQAGDYITLGTRNRANGGDILVYNPQSFGAPGNETVPATADFSCATGTTQPGTHYSGGSLGLIATRAAELAGPNSANNAIVVTNGFAPCAYQAPTTGVYGVRFTAATSGGSGASGSIATPGIGSGTVSAWNVTVRADATSTTDVNARLFTYAFVGSTGGNARPLYSTLYYITQDGYRYRQVLTGLDPNGYALYANLLGFLDTGEPLYKDIRANSALISNFPPNVSAQPPQYPIFFSDITPGNGNSASVGLVLQALGIAENPVAAQVSGVGFVGNAGGNNSTVGAGGTFTFSTPVTFTYRIVVSRDGVDFDPGNPQNRTLRGIAVAGTYSVYWDGRDNNTTNFPPGSYQYRLDGRTGEIHFPIIDAEGNINGGPIITGLNGTANSTVFFDDRGYVTRSGTAVGTLNGFLCGAASPTPPTPDHSLTGVDSSVSSGGNYYRYWPGNGNSNTDCSTTAAFGDAKGLDLWAGQSLVSIQQPLNISAAPATPDVGTSTTVTPNAFPGQTVYGSFVFRDDGNVNATGVTYSVVIGAPGEYPASVSFTLLPAGVTATYNPATGVVTLTGMPTTLAPGRALVFNFNYPAPAPGTVPVTTTIAAANESPTPGVSPNTATANTVIQIADLATTVSVPASAPGGGVVDGSITFSNLASATGTADNIVYSIIIGAAGSHPPTVTFPTLPAGVTATYDPDTGIVSLSGMPTSLAPGNTLTIGIEYTGPASGAVPVSSSVTTPTQESTTANNAATATTVFASADLSITKTDGVTTATPGGSVTYTIVASNAGPSSATGATVVDTFPASLTATWTCAGAGGGTCTASGSGNINDTVNLPSGGSVTYTVSATISANATGTLSNTATVTAPPGVTDPTPGNNSATDTDTLAPSADLAITKTDGVTTATPGGSVTYTIVASNAGPSSATGATVVDTFPASLTATWTCVGAGGGTCTASGSGKINDTVNLPSGASVTYTVLATINANATGTLSNTATVTAPAGVTDPTPGNNSATDTDTLAPSADLAITKTDGVTTATPGGSVTYTIVASNSGPSAATGATVADTLPASLTATWTCVGAGGGTCTASGSGNINDTVNLPSGGSVTYTVSATISANATGTLSNTATVTAPAGVTDPTPGNNSATDTDTLAPSADLAITKTDGVTTATPGGSVTYTIVASNAGPSSATGATVVDTLPASLTATWTCAGAGGGTCTASGSGNINDTVNLPSGGSVTYTVSATISANATGTLSNTATVTAPAAVTDPTPGNNSATDTDTLAPSADISVSKTDNSATYTPGSPVVYSIVVTNNGPSNVTGEAIGDPLPAGVTTATWACTASAGSTCTATGTGAITDSVNLASGGMATYTSRLTIPANFSGDLTNTATATNPPGTSDPTPGNNSATDTDTLDAMADIALEKHVDNAAPNVGDNVTFTVVATNNGPSDATGVAVTDGLPPGLTLLTATPSQGTYTAATGVWEIGALANGANATLTVTASVEVPGVLTNTAQVSASDQSDPDPSNNAAGAAINANASADIRIAKSVDDATPNVGTHVTFTLTANNAGPNDATGVEVSDQLPAGLSFIGATPSQGSFDAGSGVWMVGALADGASATLGIEASVDVPGSITNIATISHEDQFDPAPGNNQSGATVNGQQADIAVSKTVDVTRPDVGTNVTFTVSAHNNGPSDATGVVVGDTLPAGLTFVSATPSQGTYDPLTGAWAIGSLGATGTTSSATLSIVATVSASGPLANVATLTAIDQTDPNSTNNTASAALNGNPLADLGISKSGPATVTPGDTITYAIVVSNAGPSDATAVVVDDPTPAGLVFVGNSGACATAFPCSVGDIAVDGSVTINATYTVPADYAGANPIVNTATVASGTPDPNTTNDQASADTGVGPGIADLSLVKSGPANVDSNGAIRYTLTIHNTGPSPANGATYDDPLPAGLTAISASCGGEIGGASCGTQPVVAGNDVSGQVGAFPSGGSVVVTIDATAPQGPVTLSNTATVTAPVDVVDNNADNDQSTVATTIGAPSADLAIVKTGPANAVPGQNVTFTLELTNNGPGDATAVEITDATPPGLTFVGASTPCEGGFPCAYGHLAAGANAMLTVTYAVAPDYAGAAIVNVASLSSPTADPDGTNNIGTASVPIASADLTIVKTGPGNVAPGASITYQLRIGNLGPAAADGSTYNDPVPAEITGISASCGSEAGGAVCAVPVVNGNDVSGTIPTLPMNGAVTITITGTAPMTETLLSNTATVSPPAGLTDPTPDNNSSTVGTTTPVTLLKFEVD